MTYRFARPHRDKNHAPIVKALKKMGIAVLDLSAMGKGCPDIAAVGGPLGGTVWLVELKNPDTRGGQGGVQPHQRDWMAAWPGEKTVLWSVEDAVAWALGQPRPAPPEWAVRTGKAGAEDGNPPAAPEGPNPWRGAGAPRRATRFKSAGGVGSPRG